MPWLDLCQGLVVPPCGRHDDYSLSLRMRLPATGDGLVDGLVELSTSLGIRHVEAAELMHGLQWREDALRQVIPEAAGGGGSAKVAASLQRIA